MALPVIMHINYCEQGQSLVEACHKAVAWGFDGIEFRSRNLKADEPDEAYLDRVAEAVSVSGLRQIVFGGPGPKLAVADARKRADETARSIAFYRLASERFKLSVCNTMAGSLLNPDKEVPSHHYDRHGSHAATDDQWTWAAEGFKEIGAAVEQLGFRLAFETHMNYIHDLPTAAVRLTGMIGSPSVGVNLDYGNCVYFTKPVPIQDTIAAVGDKLFYVHLKNSIGAPKQDGDYGSPRWATALSEGEINHRLYLQTLKNRGYTGPICVEAPRAGDREWYARQDLHYIRSLMQEIGL